MALWSATENQECKATEANGCNFSMLEDLVDITMDNITMPSHTYKHSQQKMIRMTEAANTFGLRINTGETKFIYNDPSRAPI